jgi:Kinesin motor domain
MSLLDEFGFEESAVSSSTLETDSPFTKANFDQLMQRFMEHKAVSKAQMTLLKDENKLLQAENRKLQDIVKRRPFSSASGLKIPSMTNNCSRNYSLNLSINKQHDINLAESVLPEQKTVVVPARKLKIEKQESSQVSLVEGQQIFDTKSNQSKTDESRNRAQLSLNKCSGTTVAPSLSDTRAAQTEPAVTKKMAELKSFKVTIVQIVQDKTQDSAIKAELTLLRDDFKTFSARIQKLFGEKEENLKQGFRKYLIDNLPVIVSSETAEIRAQLVTEMSLRRKLHNELQDLKGNVRVFCRIRPVSDISIESGLYGCVRQIDDERFTLVQKGFLRDFMFDRLFGPESSNIRVSNEVAPFAVSVVDGYNVCIFAYGITGSGKTHTMQGVTGDPGIYETSFGQIFKLIAEREVIETSGTGWSYPRIAIAVIEVYNDEIFDLQSKSQEKLQLRQNPNGTGFQVPGLVNQPVSSVDEVMEYLRKASKSRAVSSHDMNENSSRSHLIVQLKLDIIAPNKKPLSSALTLVDLAGCERLSKTNASGNIAKEGIAINKSLSALGDVISARANKAGHVPYRNSILTSLMQETLSGDSKTLMLLQVNPSPASADETTNTLVFGEKVSTVETAKPATVRKPV